VCPVCSNQNADAARFCSQCGFAFGQTGQAHETRKIVTILFCDLIGSTALSERLDPELVRDVLLRYYESMRTCLTRHGGVVEKFIGDAVMGVLGVPAVHEDDALRAVRAAIDMRAAVDALNQELRAGAGVTIGIRVGVNTGEVLAAADVSAGQALVAGEVVNVAARLQQHAAPGEVLLGATTYRLVRDLAVAEPVAPVRMKGKQEPVQAWRLRDVRAAPAAWSRPDVPLIGREHELRRLQMLLDATLRERTSHLCTVFGDAGMGKTRLAQVFLEQAGTGGARIGIGRCQSYGGDRTLAPIAEALGQLLDGSAGSRLRGSQAEGERFTGIAGSFAAGERFEGRSTGDAPLRSLLCEADAKSAARLLDGVVREGSPGVAAAESFWAVRQSLLTLTNGQPVVLAVDGLQWAEPALLDLIDDLADKVRGVPVLLLCLARFELLDRRPSWAGGKLGASSFVLPPLSPDESRQLAESLMEVTAHGVDTDHARQVGEASGGNPLFIEQLAAMVEEGAEHGTLPPTVQALIAARLDQLDGQERTTVEWAATLGNTFIATALQELTGAADPAGVDARLDALARRRLIESSAHAGATSAYRFVNAQVRDVAYGAMPKRLRAERHEQVAAWFGRTSPDAHDTIGFHLEEAFRNRRELGPADASANALRARAARHLTLAGREALARGDLPYARNLLERGLAASGETALPDRLDAMASLADVLMASGEVGGAQRLLEEVTRSAATAGDARLAAHARLQLAALRIDTGGVAPLVEEAEAALPLFEQAGDETGLARAWLRLAQASQDSSRHGEAVARFDRALGHARQAGAELEIATTLGGLAISLWQGPRPAEDAIARCQELLAGFPDGRRAARAAVDCPLAVLRAMRRRFDEARAARDEAERVLEELGHSYALATVPVFGGLVETMAGRLEEAAQHFRQARDRFAKIGDQRMLGSATVELARVSLLQGQVAEAAALLESVPQVTEASAQLSTRAASAAIWARVLAARGEPEPAVGWSEQAVALAEQIDSPATQGMTLLDRARVLLAAGRRADARAAARDAAERFGAKGHLAGQDWAAELLERREA
jgi:class 3 adenylate cyclase/tetratricopeptide (TPR) repeat protein